MCVWAPQWKFLFSPNLAENDRHSLKKRKKREKLFQFTLLLLLHSQ